MNSTLPGVLSSRVQILLIIAIFTLVYTWIIYPVLLWVLKWKFTRPIVPDRSPTLPFVSVIMAAHNEEERVGAKLEDCLRWDYPSEFLEFIVASDGSTDSTEKIVATYVARDPRIHLIRVERAGKSQAQNSAVEVAKGEILFFTDVNTRTRPDLLRLLARNFQDPEVGMVTATVHFAKPDGAVSNGQGIYWRYELFLRAAESAIGVLATGSGQALALRRSIFRPIPSFYGDDCLLPLEVRLQGYRVVQDTQAIVYDTMPHTVEAELRVRVRMTARNWTGTLSRPALLNPIRFPLTALGLVSHKLLRWLTPFLLAIIFLTNTFLFIRHEQVFAWFLQLAFYLFALIGWLRVRKEKPAGVFAYPFSFCLANLGFLLGMIKAVRNQRIVVY